MGLDTSHDAWHGPYSSFNEWRVEIAKQIGIELRNMKGFGGEVSWDEYLSHPLYALLNHSDCDGKLTPDECKQTAFGLSPLLKTVSKDWTKETEQFIDGCLLAFSKDECIEFH